MGIGTATCRAWSKRVSVTRPPQSPCDAQACHYHATLSTMGSIRAQHTTVEHIERVHVAFPPGPEPRVHVRFRVSHDRQEPRKGTKRGA